MLTYDDKVYWMIVDQAARGNSSWMLKCVRVAIGNHLNTHSLKKEEVNGLAIL